jgi:hypothetical protein
VQLVLVDPVEMLILVWTILGAIVIWNTCIEPPLKCNGDMACAETTILGKLVRCSILRNSWGCDHGSIGAAQCGMAVAMVILKRGGFWRRGLECASGFGGIDVCYCLVASLNMWRDINGELDSAEPRA